MAAKKQLHPEAAELRAEELASSLDLYLIQSMERDELLDLQSRLGYGNTWRRWEIPKHWISRATPNFVRYDDVKGEHGDAIWTNAVRIALLLTLTTVNRSRGYSISYHPSTVATHCKTATYLGGRIAADGGLTTQWWSRLKPEQLNNSNHSRFANVLRSLCARGLLPDAPHDPVLDNSTTERDRHGEAQRQEPEDTSKKWQPFPDRFMAQMGPRVLWMVRELGPALLNCFEGCIEVRLPPPQGSTSQKEPEQYTTYTARTMLGDRRREVIRAFSWVRADGTPRTTPGESGIQLNFSRKCARVAKGAKFKTFAWPPANFSDVRRLVNILQTCHAWLLFLANGPRNSTLVDYNCDCLIPGPNGYRLAGTKWKNTKQVGGQKRDWPLPPFLVEVVQQQIRLASLVKRLVNPDDPKSPGNHLWVKSNSGGVFKEFNAGLNDLVGILNLRHLLDPENPNAHTHRFRKSLARLVALSLISSQIVLMDAFGHDDPDQTIGYMLSDKTIAADALRMQREMVILMAVDAIKEVDQLGGPFGDVVREKVYAFRRIKGTNKLEPNDMYELADQLTLGGREWVPIMEGVICTLDGLGHGPCGARRGVRRDPLHCQAGCAHQLIRAYHKTLCDEKIKAIVPLLERAHEEKNDMLEDNLTAKLLNHLFRWKDIYEKWKDYPTVVKAVQHRIAWWDVAEAKTA